MRTGVPVLVVGRCVVIVVMLVMMLRMSVGLGTVFPVSVAHVLVSLFLITIILLKVDVPHVRLSFVPAFSTCAPRARVPRLAEGSPRACIAVIVPARVFGASSIACRAGVSVLTAPAARYMLRVMRGPPARCAGSQKGGGGFALRKRGAHCLCSASLCYEISLQSFTVFRTAQRSRASVRTVSSIGK